MNTIKINSGNTLMIAHRGLSGIEVENTNSAFVAAGNRSYYGIETDIYRAADGSFVINHDGDLQQLAGEDIKVRSVSYDVLKNIVLFDKDGSKDRVDLRPSKLENYINICKKYEKHCILELKEEFSEEDTRAYIDVIRKLDYLDNVTFISFVFDNLVKLRSILPEQSAQYLVSELSDGLIDKLAESKIDIDVMYKSLTKEAVEAFHKAGIKVNCWTVNRKEPAEQLVSWGVDYITTNILE